MSPENEALHFLAVHCKAFFEVKEHAEKYGHPHPSDSRAWSQILISILTGIKGRKRKKGSDLADGSDVKAANTWGAIDYPRFNGVIKAGTKSKSSGKLKSLDEMPFIFFVLWDYTTLEKKINRCRVWIVRPKADDLFRKMCGLWYSKRNKGLIRSDNFQLHPPREKDSNVFTNKCGNLEYPLLFEAHQKRTTFGLITYNPTVLKTGRCKKTKSI